MLITVGHGTADADTFAALLHDAGVDVLIDVRTHPGSRRHPQFNRGALEEWAPDAGIAYRWEARLGGRRSPVEGSEHIALEHPSFRAYADHMTTEDFRVALAEVVEDARERTVAVMCAESVWWRCHRRLLADAAVGLHELDVRHLFHDGRLTRHTLMDVARIEGDRVVYDVGADQELPGV